MPRISDVSTALAYGVLASHKSYALGVKRLVIREHSTMLATRIATPRLSQELADLVAEHLARMYKAQMGPAWDRGTTVCEKTANIALTVIPLLADRAVSQQVHALGIVATFFQLDKEVADPVQKTPERVFLVHISIRERGPSLGLILPHPTNGTLKQVDTHQASHHTVHFHGSETVACTDVTNGAPHTWPDAHDVLTYQSDPAESATSRRSIARLMTCEDVVETIKDWDAEAIKNCARVLELDMIPFHNGTTNPFEPRLFLWQEIEESWWGAP